MIGGAIFASSKKSKEIKELENVIKENKKEEKKIEKQIDKLKIKRDVSRREIGNVKRKLTVAKKKTKELEKIAKNDDVSSASDFLKKYKK